MFLLIRVSLFNIDTRQQEALEPITHMTGLVAPATASTATPLLSPHCQLRRGRGRPCRFAFQLKRGGVAPFIQSQQAAEDTPQPPTPTHSFTTAHCRCHLALFAAGVQYANTVLFACWFPSLRLCHMRVRSQDSTSSSSCSLGYGW